MLYREVSVFRCGVSYEATNTRSLNADSFIVKVGGIVIMDVICAGHCYFHEHDSLSLPGTSL
jgi:hypothetical protein